MDFEDMWAAIREDAEFRRRNVAFDGESLENTEEIFVDVDEFERLFGSRDSEVLEQYVRLLVQTISKRPYRNLQKLHLDGSHESKATFLNFLKSVSRAHLSNLKSLVFERAVGAEGVECISNAAEQGYLPKLSCLEFWDSDIADGVVALMRAAKSGHLHALEHLKFFYAELTEDGVVALGQAIEAGSLGRLRSFALWDDDGIGDAGVHALARALRSGKVESLISLDLWLACRQAGWTALASALAVGSVPSLKELKLFVENTVPKEGSEAMARAVLSGHLCQLETLRLHNFEAGEVLVDALARGEFANLRSLEFSSCSLGREAATVVASQLELGRWPSFEHLDLSANPLGDDGVAALVRVLEEGHVGELRSLNLQEGLHGKEIISDFGSAT